MAGKTIEQMREEIVEALLEDWGDGCEEDIVRGGFKGVEEYTDEEIVVKHKEIFGR